MSRFPKGFVGITASKMQRLAKVVDEHGQLLYRAGRQVQDILNGLQLNSTSGKTISRIGDEMIRKSPDLRKRHQLAVAMDQQDNPFADLAGGAGPTIIRESDLAHIKEIQQAASDARKLRQIMGHRDNVKIAKDISKSRADLKALSQSVDRHAGDKAYLSTFWSLAGSDAAKLASFLSEQHRDHTLLHSNSNKNKTVLNAEDKKILGSLGRSLAAASRYKLLPKENWGHLTRPTNGDIWSSNMLLRYGPKGDQWDPWFLAQWSRDTLDWRRQQADQYKAQSGQQSEEPPFDLRGEEYDSSLALLRRLGENSAASRMLLGDKETGKIYAHDLVSPKWKGAVGGPSGYPISKDFSSYVAQIVRAAARQHRGNTPEAEYASRAVANMVRATNDLHPPGFTKGDSVLPAELRHALTDVAAAYVPDFAAMADKGGNDPNDLGIGHLRGNPNSPWVVTMNNIQMRSFLNEILSDPRDLGQLNGAVYSQLGPGTIQSVRTDKTGDGSYYLQELANLGGLLNSIKGDRGLTKAERADADSQANQRLFDMVAGGFGNLPMSHVGSAQAVTGFMQSAMDSAFDTEHANRAVEANEEASRDLEFNIYVPIVQALIDAGYLDRPKDVWWFKNGKIIPSVELHSWYKGHAAKHIGRGKDYDGKTLSAWIAMAREAMRGQR